MYHIYIGVGFSALLVSTDRAMREPSGCEAGNSAGSTFFFMYIGDVFQYGR